MAKIGYLYNNTDNQIIVADSRITKYESEEYFVCANVILDKYKTRYGELAYKKLGKPFILTASELDELEPVSMKCSECLFLEEVCIDLEHSIKKCWCSQMKSPLSPQYAQFVPNCKLFRSKADEYNLEKLRSDKYTAYLKYFFDNYELRDRIVIKDGKALPGDFGAINGILEEDEFVCAFGKYPDEKIVIIEDILLFRDFLISPNIYAVNKLDFDYTFYMYKNTTLSHRFFCFEKSKVAILQFYESFYVLPFDE